MSSNAKEFDLINISNTTCNSTVNRSIAIWATADEHQYLLLELYTESITAQRGLQVVSIKWVFCGLSEFHASTFQLPHQTYCSTWH